jgi:hypothetical protein
MSGPTSSDRVGGDPSPLEKSDAVHSSPVAGEPAHAETLVRDLACIGCGYNLRSLRVDGVCPECGRPIESSLRLIPRPAATATAFTAVVSAALVSTASLIFVWAAGSLAVYSGRTVVRITEEALRILTATLETIAVGMLLPAAFILRFGCALEGLHGLRAPLNGLLALGAARAILAAGVWTGALRLPAEYPARLDLALLAAATFGSAATLALSAALGARLCRLLDRPRPADAWRVAGWAAIAAAGLIGLTQLAAVVLKIALEGHEPWYALPPWIAGTGVLLALTAVSFGLLFPLRAALYAAPRFRRELLSGDAERRARAAAVVQMLQEGVPEISVVEAAPAAEAGQDEPPAAPV